MPRKPKPEGERAVRGRKRCPQCRSLVPTASRYCPACRWEFRSATVQPVTPEQVSELLLRQRDLLKVAGDYETAQRLLQDCRALVDFFGGSWEAAAEALRHRWEEASMRRSAYADYSPEDLGHAAYAAEQRRLAETLRKHQSPEALLDEGIRLEAEAEEARQRLEAAETAEERERLATEAEEARQRLAAWEAEQDRRQDAAWEQREKLRLAVRRLEQQQSPPGSSE